MRLKTFFPIFVDWAKAEKRHLFQAHIFGFCVLLLFGFAFSSFYDHGKKLLRNIKISKLFPWCTFFSLPSCKVASAPLFFKIGNKKASTKRFATLFGGQEGDYR